VEERTDRSRAERRVRTWTRAILGAGLGAAAVIFLANAGSKPDFELEKSRMYYHDLEVYGGRANVLADDFRAWFDGLWQGRNLAYTVAVLTILAALLFRFFATPAPGDRRAAPPDGRGPV